MRDFSECVIVIVIVILLLTRDTCVWREGGRSCPNTRPRTSLTVDTRTHPTEADKKNGALFADGDTRLIRQLLPGGFFSHMLCAGILEHC